MCLTLACKGCGESIPGKMSVHFRILVAQMPSSRGFLVGRSTCKLDALVQPFFGILLYSVLHLQMKKVDISAHGSAATYPLKPRR